ncbi:hypothetical protein [Clostridium botulinum]|uniref:hypothetical protein n=1 Tax=Clostridium botulinum TaxID=1491 RepID=UPI0004D7F013|nr:hypothetical protein [Clostridium botulinum]KEH99843.1 hypothetical protein Z952_p0174 [Clostridium botulinum C/D str. BKT75002]KEI05321.1 hypothetical protein Z954_0175 [Clostridium botulinum C/D str. BKT2873]QPW62009.1 hypothetical protein IG390_14240 [Clostridium botulinum]
MDTVVENKDNTIEKSIDSKKTNSKKKKTINTIIFNSKDIKGNCIQIEGFSFKLLDKELKDNVTIKYIKNNGNIEIVEIN